MTASRFQQLTVELYRIVAEMEAMYPGRHFTPYGHTVGSIGEVLAADRYRLNLTAPSTKGVDAYTANGQPVEIKATGGSRGIALRHESVRDQLQLVAMRLGVDGRATTIYNGPALPVWKAAGSVNNSGQRLVSISKLRKLQTLVAPWQMLAETP